MPSEKQLRNDVVQLLMSKGYTCWWPGRIKFRAAQDIFTMWDLIAAKKKEVIFIQFTTRSNKSSHIKKISEYRKLYDVWHEGQLWLWNGKKRIWEITIV